jgi:hypothetical protein
MVHYHWSLMSAHCFVTWKSPGNGIRGLWRLPFFFLGDDRGR